MMFGEGYVDWINVGGKAGEMEGSVSVQEMALPPAALAVPLWNELNCK